MIPVEYFEQCELNAYRHADTLATVRDWMQRLLERRTLSEAELVTHARILATWTDQLETIGESEWLMRLQEWIKYVGFSEPVYTAIHELHAWRKANPFSKSLDELVRELRSTEFAARARRVQESSPQELTVRGHVPDPLHVVYLMNQVEVSGGARIIFEHANRLCQRGMRVTIVSHFPKPDWHPIECEYVQVPFHVDLAHGIPDCDVIVATYWDQIQACVETGIAPVIYFEQGDFHLFQDLDPSLHSFVAKQINAAAFVTTVSEPISQILRTRFGREARVFPNAYNPEFFYPAHRPAKKERGYMMMMGSDRQAFKGTDDVLRAYYLVREAGFDLDLVWVSPTPLKNPVGHVVIRPTQAELGELYRNATVFVSGSKYEAFSLPVLEAMASGCPVVSTANEGVRSYAKHEFNALLVESGDAHSLADQIIRILTDDVLRENLREKGLSTAREFQWDRIIDELVIFYKQVAAYEPRRTSASEAWELSESTYRNLSKEDSIRLRKILATTRATSIQVPVVYDLFEGHQIACWETLARRRTVPETDPLRIYMPVPGRSVAVPYLDALEPFRAGDYQKALDLFVRHYTSSASLRDKETFIRWICLCLIELHQDDQAQALLLDAIQLFPYNTDLYYLYGMSRLLSGQQAGAEQLFRVIAVLGDSAGANEFFFNLNGIVKRHFEQESPGSSSGHRGGPATN